MKSMIIRFDEVSFNQAVNNHYLCVKQVMGYIDLIREINGIKIDSELFRDIVCGSGEKTDKAICNETELQLKNAKITSRSIIESSIRGDREKFYEVLAKFQSDVNIDKNCRNRLDFNGTEVYFSDQQKEILKREFTSEITSERGKELYEAHQEMVAAMNKFYDLLNGRKEVLISSFSLPMFDSKKVTLQLLAYDML